MVRRGLQGSNSSTDLSFSSATQRQFACRTRWFQAAFAFPTVLIAEYAVTGLPDCGLTYGDKIVEGDSCTSCSRVVCRMAAVQIKRSIPFTV